MRVFDSALQAIRVHRIYPTADPDVKLGCRACHWQGSDQDDADILLADMIDQEIN